MAGEGGLEGGLLHDDVARAFALVLGAEGFPKLLAEVGARHKGGLAEAERAEDGDVLALGGELALGGGAAPAGSRGGGRCRSAPASAPPLHPAAVAHLLQRGVDLRKRGRKSGCEPPCCGSGEAFRTASARKVPSSLTRALSRAARMALACRRADRSASDPPLRFVALRITASACFANLSGEIDGGKC